MKPVIYQKARGSNTEKIATFIKKIRSLRCGGRSDEEAQADFSWQSIPVECSGKIFRWNLCQNFQAEFFAFVQPPYGSAYSAEDIMN